MSDRVSWMTKATVWLGMTFSTSLPFSRSLLSSPDKIGCATRTRSCRSARPGRWSWRREHVKATPKRVHDWSMDWETAHMFGEEARSGRPNSRRSRGLRVWHRPLTNLLPEHMSGLPIHAPARVAVSVLPLTCSRPPAPTDPVRRSGTISSSSRIQSWSGELRKTPRKR